DHAGQAKLCLRIDGGAALETEGDGDDGRRMVFRKVRADAARAFHFTHRERGRRGRVEDGRNGEKEEFLHGLRVHGVGPPAACFSSGKRIPVTEEFSANRRRAAACTCASVTLFTASGQFSMSSRLMPDASEEPTARAADMGESLA